MFQLRDRARQVISYPGIDLGARFDIKRIGLRVIRGLIDQSLLTIVTQDDIQLTGNIARARFLQSKDISQFAVVRVRPFLHPVGSL